MDTIGAAEMRPGEIWRGVVSSGPFPEIDHSRPERNDPREAAGFAVNGFEKEPSGKPEN